MHDSTGGKGEDSFWDTGTRGSAPEELLLQQDGQKPKPGTTAPAADTTPMRTPGAASLTPSFQRLAWASMGRPVAEGARPGRCSGRVHAVWVTAPLQLPTISLYLAEDALVPAAFHWSAYALMVVPIAFESCLCLRLLQ